MNKNKFVLLSALAFFCLLAEAQEVDVSVNLDIKHSVKGVSDFGRERHITLHSSLVETDWFGEETKAEYLLNDLDVYLGRDNGSATWKFQYSAQDQNRPGFADIDSLKSFSGWWKEEYENILTRNNTKPYIERSRGMICGTNPHPTFPTLSYWHMCGTETERANGKAWLPLSIESSAEWMVEYLDNFFANSIEEEGELLPKYWEVINEPDMLMNTGAFMASSWEELWEYHSLVAKGIKARLGNKAPQIGGMTWGLHDLAGDDLNRGRTVNFHDGYWGNTEGDEVMRQLAQQKMESEYLTQTGPWTQWDVLWKGFMNTAGSDMDFYSLHFYDWPTYDATGGTIRSGSAVEATLEMVEWYDVYKNGIENRKPVVVSEYGAVQGAWEYKPHDRRYDWECLKPFSSMLMQFLQRPDYIPLTMPFTPIKAQWGDIKNADGSLQYPYQYKMMRDDDDDGVFEWSDYIKWFELWSEVKGTRVYTKSTDPDVQVDCYIDNKNVYLILNNLEETEANVSLGILGSSLIPQNVNIKHLYLQGEDNIILNKSNFSEAPSSVSLAAEGTMIIKYTYSQSIDIEHVVNEYKFYGEPVSDDQRVSIQAGLNTFYVNNVTVPTDSNKSQALLKITANLFDAKDDQVGFLSIDKLLINGTEVETPLDWKGKSQGRSRYFGTLDIPIPVSVLKANNKIEVDFHHSGEVNVVNIVTWETTKDIYIPVSDVNLVTGSLSLSAGSTSSLTANVLPTSASNKGLVWSTSNALVASVSQTGVVSAITTGDAIITVSSADDESISDQCSVSVSNNVINPTSITLSETTLDLSVGNSITLEAIITPNNATDKTVSWKSSDTSVATVDALGKVNAIAEGSAIITATTNTGNKSVTCDITVNNVPIVSEFIIQAEDFVQTGGTYNDAEYGGPGYGVNKSNIGINYVNSNDWAEYNLNVQTAGTYKITYYISTPSDAAQIQFYIDDSLISTDNVSNNNNWDSYNALQASSEVVLPVGSHVVKILASGTSLWQWNLDKIVLSNDLLKQSSSNYTSLNNLKVELFPNPVSNKLGIQVEGITDSLVEIMVFSSMGNLLKSEFISEGSNTIDVSDLVAGMYIVKIRNGNINSVKRFIKK
ncbi:Ig-like domain-containing protein [Saccharicrinis aurantiacus]|uniref:Ig-like domain-containing protein n=1 Tax=Saccharicrinis aurantiacus TaxID=1849719 RepID=UPI00094F7173|nr:Ig-like domain-containing protein [Saccharicrinis aurantiacus]